MIEQQNFTAYLRGIAPEGETVLFVRQKPLLDGGVLQFHNDNAIKCTWPAFLPEQAKIKKGDAWYANTACFILDRFKDGKFPRQVLIVSALRSWC